MFIKPDGEFNRWRICKNKDTNEVEIHYEGLSLIVGKWLTVSMLVFDEKIYSQVKHLKQFN